MSKIIGVTVGTPISPERLRSKMELDKELDEIRQDIAYMKLGPVEIKSFSNNVRVAEMGSQVKTVTANWTLSRDPVRQVLSYQKNAAAGETVTVDPKERKAVLTDLDLKTSAVFTLSVFDEMNAVDTAVCYIEFHNGIYYGALPYGGDIDSGAILGMSKVLQGVKKLEFTVTPGEGERPALALPKRISQMQGNPVFKIGGFEYEWEKVAAFEFTNASGYTEEYDVWMHGQNVTGSITVNVT
jgi:hypothetical protein